MPPNDFSERKIKTRRAVSPNGDVIYGAEIESSRLEDDDGHPSWVTETHEGGAQAACGCLIAGDLKPRFHRDGTMVCTAHWFFCSACGRELLPLDVVVIEKRVYCRACGESALDDLLETERRSPGSFDRALVAHLRLQKRTLWGMRWKTNLGRLFGRT